jgi:hypothetical protein
MTVGLVPAIFPRRNETDHIPVSLGLRRFARRPRVTRVFT